MAIRSGYVSIIGKPNVGKSTLLNALLGQKLSITNPKPQTTRKKILGIYSDEEHQVVFADTPGILKPDYLLQEKMLEYITNAIKDADILLVIIDIAADKEGKQTLNDENVISILDKVRRPKILIINKVDLSIDEEVKHLIKKVEATGKFNKIIPVSALLSFNIQSVLNVIFELIPEHPKYFPDDQITDENERFFVSEIIREKILEIYHEEIPYSVEVVIEDFKERVGRKDFIQAAIFVERESQKPIIIGKEGKAIKELGETARKDIEAFLDRPVFLDLRVKVKAKWRSDPKSLKNFGYTTDND
ncbi:MAG: GTPase Era [Ignavibacteriales bacterium]|nr:MAG: GTPase Era [Ignavibacteriales bacterium]